MTEPTTLRTSPRNLRRLTILSILSVGLAMPSAYAGSAPEAQCQSGRYKAAKAYAACEFKIIGTLVGGGALGTFQDVVSKCRTKYTSRWASLQAKAAGTGSTCDAPRFVDNGDGTVTDALTALQWEQKTDDGSKHDKDNLYAWSAMSPYVSADGPVFTDFLSTLNTACFAGHCDWRLPTIEELQTILLEPFRCATDPCIDAIFGPAIDANYWSSTTNVNVPNSVWDVGISYGVVNPSDGKVQQRAVRAVRGGL
jgi:hypothetical protein